LVFKKHPHNRVSKDSNIILKVVEKLPVPPKGLVQVLKEKKIKKKVVNFYLIYTQNKLYH
jgi:hypothetical protein